MKFKSTLKSKVVITKKLIQFKSLGSVTFEYLSRMDVSNMFASVRKSYENLEKLKFG